MLMVLANPWNLVLPAGTRSCVGKGLQISLEAASVAAVGQLVSVAVVTSALLPALRVGAAKGKRLLALSVLRLL